MSTPESIEWDAEMETLEYEFGHYCENCDSLMVEVDGLHDFNYLCVICDVTVGWDE